MRRWKRLYTGSIKHNVLFYVSEGELLYTFEFEFWARLCNAHQQTRVASGTSTHRHRTAAHIKLSRGKRFSCNQFGCQFLAITLLHTNKYGKKSTDTNRLEKKEKLDVNHNEFFFISNFHTQTERQQPSATMHIDVFVYRNYIICIKNFWPFWNTRRGKKQIFLSLFEVSRESNNKGVKKDTRLVLIWF